MDQVKLVKLLNLTFSDNDAEALLALRKASEMLKAERLMWNDVIGQAPKPEPLYGAVSPDVSDHELVRRATDVCSERALDLVESVADYYRRRGYITPKQRDALLNIISR